MTYAIRPNGHLHFGPGDFKMPDDGILPLLSGPYPQIHEDAEDCINADGTSGPEYGGNSGGSGICMGYARKDYDNILMMEAAVHNRTVFYDWAHYVRQFRYAIARTCLIRDTIGPRRVLQYANIARTAWSETGPVYFGTGWHPQNIHQLHEDALHNPHTGIDCQLRELGWVAYIEAMACKVDSNRSKVWLQMFLQTCEMAAFQGTGQIGSSVNSGGEATIPVHVQYTFHWGILAHAAICACRVLGLPTPQWVIEGMSALDAQKISYDYYGCPSMAAFMYSENGKLIPATGPGQHGDPAFGWWSNNCAALSYTDPTWAAKCSRWGPTTFLDEQSKKFTMLARGLAS